PAFVFFFSPPPRGCAASTLKNYPPPPPPRPFGYQCIILFFSPNVNTWVDFIILSIFVVVSAGFMPYIQR
ncbi:hypothetical protein, partial [Klebsiella pneumoniae]|uniref:hypothetical protein n=1 Tax=Klebsiella pneumoniae TaxID=573 RepID=UPI0019D0029D